MAANVRLDTFRQSEERLALALLGAALAVELALAGGGVGAPVVGPALPVLVPSGASLGLAQ